MQRTHISYSISLACPVSRSKWLLSFRSVLTDNSEYILPSVFRRMVRGILHELSEIGIINLDKDDPDERLSGALLGTCATRFAFLSAVAIWYRGGSLLGSKFLLVEANFAAIAALALSVKVKLEDFEADLVDDFTTWIDLEPDKFEEILFTFVGLGKSLLCSDLEVILTEVWVDVLVLLVLWLDNVTFDWFCNNKSVRIDKILISLDKLLHLCLKNNKCTRFMCSTLAIVMCDTFYLHYI